GGWISLLKCALWCLPTYFTPLFDIILTYCCPLSLKRLGILSEDVTLPKSIIRFNRLLWLEFQNSYFLQEISKIPKTIRGVNASNCFSLNSESLTKILLQFGRILGLPQIMACLGVRDDILLDSQSSSKLWKQTDLSSWVPCHKFFEFKLEFCKSQYWLRDYYDDDTPCDCHIIIPRNKIPKWFNHESVESSISLWVGLELPTFTLCVAFCLADEDEYCIVDIFINGHKQMLEKKFFFEMHCDHQWFYGASHRLLQEDVGNLIQGDRNHI
ncbi:hypothetical protein CFP56_024341, partial [Quercus suber]